MDQTIVWSKLMKTVLLLTLAAACGDPAPLTPPVSRVWPVLGGGTMMSAAVWGADTVKIGRALDAVRDSTDHPGRASFDSLRREARRATGVALGADDIEAGAALDRAAPLLAGAADSALLDIGGHFLWSGPRSTRRSAGIAHPASSLGH